MSHCDTTFVFACKIYYYYCRKHERIILYGVIAFARAKRPPGKKEKRLRIAHAFVITLPCIHIFVIGCAHNVRAHCFKTIQIIPLVRTIYSANLPHLQCENRLILDGSEVEE